jgi:transcription-repair coupling factor (superfamily II helicase)
VDIGITAIVPKTWIPNDRQRMDVYRRLTRCTSLEMLEQLIKDITDAFGEPPRQALVLFALTELRLLAGLYGIESIIRKEPDVVLTVRDAGKAQLVLSGAPGTLRVIDEKTVYLRMPKTYLEPETLLMVLRNLIRSAHEKLMRGEAVVDAGPQAPASAGRAGAARLSRSPVAPKR